MGEPERSYARAAARVTRLQANRSLLFHVRPDELERRLRERLDALGPAPRAELLHVLMLPDFERADRIGEFWGYPESRAFAEPGTHRDVEEGVTGATLSSIICRASHPVSGWWARYVVSTKSTRPARADAFEGWYQTTKGS